MSNEQEKNDEISLTDYYRTTTRTTLRTSPRVMYYKTFSLHHLTINMNKDEEWNLKKNETRKILLRM